MTPQDDPSAVSSAAHQSPLSRWDNEGGAIATAVGGLPADIPALTNAELVQLRIRVIALENLVIALLAQGSDGQRGMADDMAAHIAPRTGTAHHPLTERAVQQMNDLVRRARQFRDLTKI
jgi:hypothetical protein